MVVSVLVSLTFGHIQEEVILKAELQTCECLEIWWRFTERNRLMNLRSGRRNGQFSLEV